MFQDDAALLLLQEGRFLDLAGLYKLPETTRFPYFLSFSRARPLQYTSLPPSHKKHTKKKSLPNTSTTTLELSHFDPRYSLLLDLQPYKFDFGPVQEGLLPYLNYSLQLLNLGVFVFDELIDLEGTECNKHVVIERTHNKNIVTILLFQ
jgi:hypothetical protein